MTAAGPRLAASDLEEALPRGYRLVRVLSRRAGTRVVLAVHEGREVVVRLEERGGEALAELAVLAAVDHPGLARAVDHGALPGAADGPDGARAAGGRFLAREWIEGVELSQLAGARSAKELGALVARLCVALDYLHSRGFVHADLKPANVIVRPGDLPVLTDFGLARRLGRDAAGRVDGTPFHIAPEVLLGYAPDARADLFALGVVLHDLLVPASAGARDARAFYGRFPGEPFLDVVGTDLAQLPGWSRDLLAGLLATPRGARPPSAAHVGRTLASRLRLEPLDWGGAPRLQWPVLRGREELVAEQAARLREPRRAELSFWAAAKRENTERLADEACVALSLSGVPLRRVRFSRELAELEGAHALDRWVRDTLSEARGSVLFLSALGGDPWTRSALGFLVRCARRARTPVVACGAGEPPPEDGWSVIAVPGPGEASIAAFLEAELEGAGEAAPELAARMHAECQGSAEVLQELLDDLAQSEWVRSGELRPRLRSGALPHWVGRTRGRGREGRLTGLRPESRRLVAALWLLSGRAELARVAAVADVAAQALREAVRELTGRGIAALASGAQALVLELRESSDVARRLELAPADWAAAHARVAELLRREGAEAFQILPHELEAGAPDAPDAALLAVVDEAARLCDLGSREQALALFERLRALARARGAELDPLLRAHHALAWVFVGEIERGERAIAQLAAETPRVRAVVERVHGQIAKVRKRHAAAREHFERALALDPSGAPDVLLAQASALYDAADDAALDELFQRLADGAFGALPGWIELNVRNVHAMSCFRRGDRARALALLGETLRAAEERGDLHRQAATWLNLGVIARRGGELERALEHFEAAECMYDRASFLIGVAQARTMTGGTLRELGELRRAERLLGDALELRERLGDAAGVGAVRGTLALVFAERGHLVPAAEELEAALRALGPGGQAAHRALLEAKLDELRTRLGRPRERLEPVERDLARVEPRIDLARARAHWMADDPDAAKGAARAALEHAERLGRRPDAAEARSLLAQLGAPPPADPEAAADPDRRVLDLLLAPRCGAEALELARELSRRGRDDRAARLSLAVAARDTDPTRRAEGRRIARASLLACEHGSTVEEAARSLQFLLGRPDPLPADLPMAGALAEDEEDSDVDVLSILDINRRLVEEEELPSLLGAIVESALETTGAERGFLVLEERGELSLDLALDSRRGDMDDPEVEFSHSIVHHALEAGRVLRLSNASDDPVLGVAPSVTGLELRSILCCPFDVDPDEEVRGVIYVDHRLRTGAFSERAERLLTLLAGQAALAIRQVRRLEHKRRLADELKEMVATQESDIKTYRRALVDAGVTVPVGGLVGDSPAMRRVHDLLNRLAPSDLPVLVCGRSGTGKELAARALHDLSPHAEGPFVSENCAALPPSLIEGELFGYRRGAFTGAERDQEGLFERAGGGTLFLDEIGELPLELQAKLLRVLETREVRRLGDTETRRVEFRLLAATNRDLAREVEEGRFRSDLFYRLDAVRIEMPPLAERVADIPALVDHFLRLEEAKSGRAYRMSPDVLRRLCDREWPGNVRELGNEVARLCVLSGDVLDDAELVRDPDARWPEQRSGSRSGPIQPLAELERQAILDALERTGGDKRRAADLLGISRAKIYQRLQAWRDVE